MRGIFVSCSTNSRSRTADGRLPDTWICATSAHSVIRSAAAQACQTDARFTACLNQDGMAGWRPFNVNSGVWRPKQRFMMIYRAVPPGPPPAEFAELLKVLMHGYETAMQTVPGGAYEVALDSSKTTHMD